MTANPWTTLVDSGLFRRITGGTAGRAMLRSRLYRDALLRKSYLTSAMMNRRQPEVFCEVRAFCLFIGHNKSGTSLIGSLLDAHPDAVVADDMDALRFVAAGFSRDQICHLLAAGARRDFQKGRVTARRVGAYSFLVPDGRQGSYRRALVVGDSTSGSTTRRLGEDPALLDRLRATAGGAAVRFIFVVRNPFDPISYIMVRGNRSFENAVDHYFTNCATALELRRRIGPDDVLTVHYESFVSDCEAWLRRACDFLGLQPEPGYPAACAAVVSSTPQRERDRVVWDAPRRAEVMERMRPFDFLDGYTFDS